MKGSAQGNWDPREVISTQPKRGRGPHHHVEADVNWCSTFLYRISNLHFYIFTFLYGILIKQQGFATVSKLLISNRKVFDGQSLAT